MAHIGQGLVHLEELTEVGVLHVVCVAGQVHVNLATAGGTTNTLILGTVVVNHVCKAHSTAGNAPEDQWKEGGKGGSFSDYFKQLLSSGSPKHGRVTAIAFVSVHNYYFQVV